MRRDWATYFFAAFLSIYLVGCGLFGGSDGGAGHGPPPVPVTLLALEDIELFEQISLMGECRSKSDGALTSLTSGVVSQLLVDVGDEVQAGQEVAYLDGVEQRIALAEAEAKLAESRSNLEELLNGTRPAVLRQRESESRAARARESEALARLKAIRELAPQRVKQAEGDYLVAAAVEKNAADELRRTEELVKQGALSTRELVLVQTAWDRARGALLRAEQARSVQDTTNQRDEAEAVASLEQARADLARYGALLSESQEGPREEVISAQREVVAALAAARDRAMMEYERATIRASSAGTVKARLVSVGDRLEDGDTAFELGGQDVEFYFEAPESVQGRVKVGQTVLLGPEALKGEVVGVAQAVDVQSRRQSLRVQAKGEGFLPGASVSGILLIPVGGDYLVTHRDALVDKKGRWVLFTVNDEAKAEEHTVELVVGVGEQVAVRSAELKAGAEIVGRGAPGLYPGADVLLPKPDPTPGASP
jgi:HlyD family secretion protein